ncbi:hypothetical protein [Candidatus Protochlamydia amoebophila]|uniref:Uncharacterized protein n=1 Tax=Candidatus Protochlamydia amoebophila TaxID=362787 RepID=A0A0C1H7U3_9BACT|nr:hypothetical protein [Candidatus Protochlamydia amoebophila]KIC70963.1 hypothetical protein DB44_FE00140 [Candidatus Protochlamydia amoebophila]
MLISIFAIVLAYLTQSYFPSFNPQESSILIIAGSLLVLLLTVLSITLSLLPLQRLEQNLVPNLVELYKRNHWLKINRFCLFLFPLVSFFAVNWINSNSFQFKEWIMPIWLVTFGLSLDLLKCYWQNLMQFLNPSDFVNMLTRQGKKAVQNEKDDTLWSCLDNLSEIAVRSIEKSKIALSTQTLKSFPPIVDAFFASSKSISRINVDAETEKKTGRDEASFTIFYLLQRLELINDRALQNRLETVCRQMIMTMGKLIVSCAKFDLTMVDFPTHFLTKFGLKALQHHFEEVGVLTTSTLLEIAKTILKDVNINYAELQSPFQAIVNGLNAIAKATFKKEKNTSIKLLVQPFEELKTMFQAEKMVNHPDTSVIIHEIDRILEEFTVLGQVMRSIPPIPNLEDDSPTTANSNLK